MVGTRPALSLQTQPGNLWPRLLRYVAEDFLTCLALPGLASSVNFHRRGALPLQNRDGYESLSHDKRIAAELPGVTAFTNARLTKTIATSVRCNVYLYGTALEPSASARSAEWRRRL
jgi:hypothetical protein